MIYQCEENCAKILIDLNIAESDIKATQEILGDKSNEVLEVLSNPSVKFDEKEGIIDKLFPISMQSFLKVMCQNDYIEGIDRIFSSYDNQILNIKGIINATLFYVTKPSDDIIKSYEEMLKKKYNSQGAVIKLVEDKSLIGGYKLQVGDRIYDKTIKGTIKAMQKKLARRWF